MFYLIQFNLKVIIISFCNNLIFIILSLVLHNYYIYIFFLRYLSNECANCALYCLCYIIFIS